MSDFLTNVLRRGAGLLPVIPPRAPDPVPEAEPIAPSPEIVSLDAFDEAPVSPAERTNARVLSAAKDSPGAAPPSIPSAPTVVPHAPIALRATPPDGTAESPNAARKQVRSAPAPVPEQPRAPAPLFERWSAAPQEFTQPTPPVTAQYGAPERAVPKQPAPSPASEPFESILRQDPQPAVVLAEAPTPQRHPASPPAAAAVGRPSEPRRVLAEPAVQGELSEPYPLRSSEPYLRWEEARAEQPAVRVTIGRIEIRTPAAPPPAAKPPQVSAFADHALARRFLDRRWY